MMAATELCTPSGIAQWSSEEEQEFEKLLAETQSLDDSDGPDTNRRWEAVAVKLPNKSVEACRERYQSLVEDISNIEAGKVPLPNYDEEEEAGEGSNSDSQGGPQDKANGKGRCSKAERKKGVPWTEEEHKLFLLGLAKYGKGDWRSISRNFVISRTPTQVASHAQKYFIRLQSFNKERRRSSIHDITTVTDTPYTQQPITGRLNSQLGSSGQIAPAERIGIPLSMASSNPVAMNNMANLSAMIPGNQPGHVGLEEGAKFSFIVHY